MFFRNRLTQCLIYLQQRSNYFLSIKYHKPFRYNYRDQLIIDKYIFNSRKSYNVPNCILNIFYDYNT